MILLDTTTQPNDLKSTIVTSFFTLLTVVLTLLINKWFEHLSNRRKIKKEEIEKRNNLDVLDDARLEAQYQEIYAAIRQVLKDSVVNCIWGFHNGSNYLSGKHDLKMSLMSEWVNVGVESGMMVMQNRKWREFIRFIDPLQHNDYYISHEFEERDEVALIHQNHQVNTVITCKITNEHGLTLGLFVIKFPHKVVPTDNEMAELMLHVRRIEALI